jgi:membrane peptidoglycan carboxypeptidase
VRLVLENKTGRVLAMVGGFSYSSQLNRHHGLSQPGSSIKPLTYLSALLKPQPNTLVMDSSMALPPIRGRAIITGRRKLRSRRLGRDHHAACAGEPRTRHRAASTAHR